MDDVKKLSRVVFVAPLLLLAGACGDDAGTPATPPPSAAPLSAAAPTPISESASAPPADPAARAAATVATLSDEDLAGQVLMPYAYGGSATQVDAGSAAGNRSLAGVDTPAQMIAKYRLGGLILVSFTQNDPTGKTNPTSNVENPKQVRALTDGLQAAARQLPAGAPLMIGTDQEYGIVTRVTDGVTALPSALAIGAAGKPELTEAAWHAAGRELAAMGITVDFAPVADTLGTAGSSVIGSRSYGTDAQANANQVAAAVRGMQAAGVAAALKHFPGHGHTTGDSHDELPVIKQNLAAWKAQDLPPFQAGVQAGAGVVMSGHLNLQAVDKGTAATFSHKIMTDVLRGQLKFTGVAITDAMNMEPAKKWPAGEAAVRALNAGNDMLLMPPDIGAARDGIVSGLKSGSLKRERLVEAVTRILTLKFRTAATPQPDLSVLGSAPHQQAVSALDAASITVLRGKCAGPLVNGPVRVTAPSSREVARVNLVHALQAAGVQVQAAGGAEIRLVGYGDKPVDLSPDAAVTVMMDLPGLLAYAKSPTLVATYSSSKLSLTALAAVIAGKTTAPGKSPIAVAGLPRSACAK
ncbi:beta-N-acetylhexosaminidase [Actinoplanes octamycinicus]|uniref:beta-N-acetylhexosaminidase n=1 Tax=Actinoplanes octamycinicus TaxID=135948 RepID=A0A7W7GWR8_9ACTN|nr:glycoside hydrolase family 3 N-terminal domain-containing protein [Actinoplanes octamycinicus]MBB4739582.1 beta-N-acetylhexosaminidase [Actinoplanes octamycinicus]GIE54763.1 beta-N-acetylhexosaminidase [Actinoplanes octamycinicus]